MIKKTSDSGIKNENMLNKELVDELHKPIIKKIEKKKVNSLFIDNICGVHLAEMQLINKCNKRICFYYVLLIFSVNTHELFFWKIKKVLQLPMLFKNF